MAKTSNRYVRSLDGLRAIAVLGVIGYHMGLSWCSGGLLGVPIMFVLSGYLITGLLVLEYRRTERIDLRSFWVRRVRRLMPQAVTCVVVTAALCTLFNHVLLTKMRGDVVPSLLMYLNWSKIFSNESYFAAAGGPSPLTHYWTLAIEAQFYLVWPPILYLFLRKGARNRVIEGFVIVLAIASALLMAFLYTPDADPSRAYYGTDSRMFSLLMGCLLAFLWPFDEASERTVTGASVTERLAIELAGVASIAAMVFMMVKTKGYAAFTFRGGTLLCSALAMISIAALMPQGSLVSRVLSLRPLVWLGSRSYALYLWHYPIVQLMTNRNSTSPTSPWWYLLEFALSLAAAELSYRFIEEPLRHRGAIPQALRNLVAMRSDGVAKVAVAASHAKATGEAEGAEASSEAPDVRPTPLELLVTLARTHIPLIAAVSVTLVAVFGLAFAPAVNAVGGGASDKRVSAATLRKPLADGTYDVVLIGDSVALDAASNLNAAFPHGLVDCAIGRQASEALDVYDSYSDQGVVGNIVIFSVGTNGTLTQDVLDSLVAAAGSDKSVYFINNRMPDDFQDENNALLANLPNLYPNVKVIDWYSLSSGHDDWFWGDGTHLRQESGAMEAFTSMIVNAIGYEQIEVTPTTYDVTFIGDAVALDASDALSKAYPQGVIDCADGRSLVDSVGEYKTYASQGVVGEDVVLAVESDKVLDESDLESAVEAVGSDHKLWLVNSRTGDPWCQENNDLIAKVAANHQNVEVIDWYQASAGHDDWFAGDGTHLSGTGIAAYVNTVLASVDPAAETAAANEAA